MLFENIKVGNRVEISLPTESEIKKSHVSQVEDIIKHNQVLLHMPISYGQLVKLQVNMPYQMLFFTDKGMLQFQAQVVAFTREGELHFMVVDIKNEGERIQLREFFRFTCLLPIKFAIIDDDSTNEASKAVLQDGIIKDIGGGGIRFVSNLDMESDSIIRCILMLNDDCLIIYGKVLHKQHFPKSNYKFQYRILFVGQFQTEQEKIIQYIFNEQRRLISKSKADLRQ